MIARVLVALAVLAASGCGRARVNPSGGPVHPACPDGAPSLAWPTFHGDRARTGWNAAETDLTPRSVSSSFGWLWETDQLDTFDDGTTTYPPRVHASPLYLDDAPVGGAPRSVVVTATSNAWVYAIAACGADSGTVLWKTQLGTPAFVPHLDGGLPLGVLSTPAIDLTTSPARLYVTSIDAQAGWQAFALDLSTGGVLPGWPITLDPATLNAFDSNGPASFQAATAMSQRAGLNLSPDGGYLYVGFATFEDTAPGWLVAVDTRRAAVAATFSAARSTDAGANGGIWGPGGPAVDDDGHVFVTTGNSDVGPVPGLWGESLLRFTQGLSLDGTYTVFNHCALDAADIDIGGSSPLLLPPIDPAETATPRLLVLGGKQGNVYLVERDRLPGRLDQRPACSTDSTTDGSLLPPDPQPQFGARGPLNVFGPYSEEHGNLDNAKMRSTPAYFSDGGGRFVFVSGATKAAVDSTTSAPPSLVKLRVVTAPGQPAYLAVERADTKLAFINPGSPVVSSYHADDPVVWVLDENAGRNAATLDPAIASPILYAVDGETLEPLWQSAADQVHVGGKYGAPVVAHGFVFIATDRLQVFGLRN